MLFAEKAGEDAVILDGAGVDGEQGGLQRDHRLVHAKLLGSDDGAVLFAEGEAAEAGGVGADPLFGFFAFGRCVEAYG